MENFENVGGKRAQDLHCANYMRAKRVLLLYFLTQTAHQNLLHNSVFFILYFEQTWWQQKIENCLIDLVSEFYQIADLFIFTKEIQ